MGDKLKLGILDLMTILVPGGFLFIFLRPYIKGYIDIIGSSFPNLATKDAALYIGFIAIAYILGCFIYFLASYLDEWVYENVSKVFWSNAELTAHIVALKAEQTGIPSRKVINAFKWSCGWLLKNHPPMYEEVERLMAESKFFRSMVIVSLIAGLLIIQFRPMLMFPLLLLSLFSLIRYLTQRKKSIATAYEYIIIATEKRFNEKPEPEAYFDISRKRIATEDKPINRYELHRKQLLADRFFDFSRKLSKVLQLCFNPFYQHPVSPQGEPGFKSTEVRWFTKEQDHNLMLWFDDNIQKVNGNTEQRTDTYFLKRGNKEMSIKKRNEKFEIKQKVTDLGPVHLSDTIAGKGEYWYKWVLNNLEGSSLEKDLVNSNYKQLNVTKIRKALKLTISTGDNNAINQYAADKELPEGFQIEYTTVIINDTTWFTFAIESFGKRNASLTELQHLEIFKQIHLQPADSCSYPEFLCRITDL